MGDILKEAIADAKAVRETALENAKMALEEAFTPQIKSMLSAKLKEDDMDDDEVEEFGHDDEEEVPAEEQDEFGDEEEVSDEVPVEDEEEPEVDESKIIEIDGVQYAPVVSEDDEFGGEEDETEDEDIPEESLDLEAIIKELEDELSEGEDEDEDAEEVEESTEETVSEETDETVEESKDETVEEEYEIDEAAITEEDDEDEEEVEESVSEDNSELSEVQAELKEYKEAVHFLKDKLHEVNILNAKLLFTNKLFKSYSLDNNQKLKVVETFDRAQTTREIKLVYSTLAEQFADNGSIVTKKSISESASAPVSSTKPSKESRKVISEETQVADRFKKLAGLIK